MVAREAVAGLRIDCGAIPSDAGNLTGRIGLVEIKDRQSCGTASTADVVSVTATARVALGGLYNRRPAAQERSSTEASRRKAHLAKSPFRCARSEPAPVKPERP